MIHPNRHNQCGGICDSVNFDTVNSSVFAPIHDLTVYPARYTTTTDCEAHRHDASVFPNLGSNDPGPALDLPSCQYSKTTQVPTVDDSELLLLPCDRLAWKSKRERGRGWIGNLLILLSVFLLNVSAVAALEVVTPQGRTIPFVCAGYQA